MSWTSILVFSLSASAAANDLSWEKLRPIPDREGFAGTYAGVSQGALLVAGGANFPDKKPWDGGAKAWSDNVFVLEDPKAEWRKVGKLPRPLGYGESITVAAGVLCLGGADADKHYSDCFLLELMNGEIRRTTMKPLPQRCAYACAAKVGQRIYMAGGIETPTSTKALKTFWELDLANPQAGWRALEPWPGPPRMLAVAATDGVSFYLFSGADLSAGADSQPVRHYLRDAFAFTPGKGWTKLPELPRPAVAAPTPAPQIGGRFLIVSGGDGTNVNFEPRAKHPGFRRDALAYDPVKATWASLGEVPMSISTVPFVEWRRRFVIPNGEVRPGVRTPEVWAVTSR